MGSEKKNPKDIQNIRTNSFSRNNNTHALLVRVDRINGQPGGEKQHLTLPPPVPKAASSRSGRHGWGSGSVRFTSEYLARFPFCLSTGKHVCQTTGGPFSARLSISFPPSIPLATHPKNGPKLFPGRGPNPCLTAYSNIHLFGVPSRRLL